MRKKGKISQYRERLDKTLASPELTNHDTLKNLIRNQLLHSSLGETEGCNENVIERKTTEVSNFLEMLRSASVDENEGSKSTEHGEWKLKEDNEEFRVMYRPGPEGTPFHTLLAEGYIDGPIDKCLCVSWESTLYRKWWPHYIFPPFKILNLECLQRIQIGEQISLVRVKVPWPLSAREAIVHYFLFEYFQDDLVVALVNTIDVGSVDMTTHGFAKDGIPEAKDVVRIDVIGGFALQKVTSERSYFRTTGNMDMKLDFVPPSFINFVSRQLIGGGFRFYQKVVASVMSNHDEDYRKVLEDPLYARIRKALYSTHELNGTVEEAELKSDACFIPEGHSIKALQENTEDTEQSVHGDKNASESLLGDMQAVDKKAFDEIEEENSEGSQEKNDKVTFMELKVNNDECLSEILQIDTLTAKRKAITEIEEEEEKNSVYSEEDGDSIVQSLTDRIAEKDPISCKRNVVIRHEVEQALETLNKAISFVREYGPSHLARSSTGLHNEEVPNLEKGAEKNSTILENSKVCLNAEVSVEVSREGNTMERISEESRNSSGHHDVRRAGSNSFTREVNHNRIVPSSSPEQDENNQVALPVSKNGTTDFQIVDIEGNGIDGNILHEGKESSKQKSKKYCCFGFISGN